MDYINFKASVMALKIFEVEHNPSITSTKVDSLLDKQEPCNKQFEYLPLLGMQALTPLEL